MSCGSYKALDAYNFPQHKTSIKYYSDTHHFVSHFQQYASLETTKEFIRKDSIVFRNGLVDKIIKHLYDNSGTTEVFRYNNKNRLIEKVLEYTTGTSKTTYYYDKNRLVKEVTTDSNSGTTTTIKTYKYNKPKREVMSTMVIINTVDSDTLGVYIDKEKYNRHGLVTEYSWENTAETESRVMSVRFTYNSHNLVKRKETHVNGKLEALDFYTYQYDAYGNWIALNAYSSPRQYKNNPETHRYEDLSSTMVREIVYE